MPYKLHFYTDLCFMVGKLHRVRLKKSTVAYSEHNFSKYWPIFTVRRSALQGLCDSNSVRPSVRPSVRLSVCHTRGLCPHGLTYVHDFFTVW